MQAEDYVKKFRDKCKAYEGEIRFYADGVIAGIDGFDELTNYGEALEKAIDSAPYPSVAVRKYAKQVLSVAGVDKEMSDGEKKRLASLLREKKTLAARGEMKNVYAESIREIEEAMARKYVAAHGIAFPLQPADADEVVMAAWHEARDCAKIDDGAAFRLFHGILSVAKMAAGKAAQPSRTA